MFPIEFAAHVHALLARRSQRDEGGRQVDRYWKRNIKIEALAILISILVPVLA